MSDKMEKYLITFAAPTLAGLKSSNMFRIKYSNSHGCLLKEIREVNKQLKSKGIALMALRINDDSALLLLFRWSSINNILSHTKTLLFLKQMGYNGKSTGQMLSILRRNFSNKNFPHEVGIFLDYPLTDVKCFINNEKCKACGTWKVYSNEENAKKTFHKYNHCTKVYKNAYENGIPFHKMVVSG